MSRAWAGAWPDTITLGDAADEIDFDLFVGDDEHLVLVKTTLPIADLPVYDLSHFDDDAEDRTGRLMDGLRGGPEDVPPVVVLSGKRVSFAGMRDGHHRVAIAAVKGWARVPAYVPAGAR